MDDLMVLEIPRINDVKVVYMLRKYEQVDTRRWTKFDGSARALELAGLFRLHFAQHFSRAQIPNNNHAVLTGHCKAVGIGIPGTRESPIFVLTRKLFEL